MDEVVEAREFVCLYIHIYKSIYIYIYTYTSVLALRREDFIMIEPAG